VVAMIITSDHVILEGRYIPDVYGRPHRLRSSDGGWGAMDGPTGPSDMIGPIVGTDQVGELSEKVSRGDSDGV